MDNEHSNRREDVGKWGNQKMKGRPPKFGINGQVYKFRLDILMNIFGGQAIGDPIEEEKEWIATVGDII